MGRFIRVSGARQHNLKDISVAFPIGMLTVITGDSGSGKSTLAQDVLYQESRRRYLAALTGEVEEIVAPEVDLLEPVLAAVAVNQFSLNRNPRSTVATYTGLKQVLKGILSLAGRFHCSECGRPIELRTRENVLRQLATLNRGTRLTIKAPVLTEDKESVTNVLEKCAAQGFLRCQIGDQVYYLEDLISRDKVPQGTVQMIIDRIVIKAGSSQRIADSVRQAVDFSKGISEIEVVEKESVRPLTTQYTIRFSEVPYCFECGVVNGSRSSGNGSNPSSIKNSNAICKKIDGLGLEDLLSMTINDLKQLMSKWIRTWKRDHRPEFKTAAQTVVEVSSLLETFVALGLGYLRLDTPIRSLSSGERLKVRIGNALGRRLSGILYILDEPMSGLSAGEKKVVSKQILRLKEAGNTVVVVEHDRAFIKSYADYVIELGPQAGEKGGEVVYEGPAEEYIRLNASDWLASKGPEVENTKGLAQTQVAGDSLDQAETITLDIEPGAFLKLKRVKLPLGRLITLYGPSGSGKSALAQALFQALRAQLDSGDQGAKKISKATGTFSSKPLIGQVWYMDETLPKGSRTSVVATSIGVYRHIATLFARTPMARARGFNASYFSLSKKGGRCEKCKGTGMLLIEPEFLPPIRFVCDSCGGLCFNQDVLSIEYKGVDPGQMLKMTVSQAVTFFRNIKAIRQPLEVLERTGLGYLSLGQPITTLSGGERQRLKLASVLAKKRSAIRGFFILDNVSRGLSSRDILNLIRLLLELTEQGHTVLVVENKKPFLECSGWTMEMGPGMGPEGGMITYQGRFRPERA